MKASLETIPKYRITFSRTNPADDPAPDNLGLERRDDGGWHLWSESEEFSGIIIPAEAVEHLVMLLSRVGLGARSISTPILDPAPEPPKASLDPALYPDQHAIYPDPGYRRLLFGEVSRDGDLWKFPFGMAFRATPGIPYEKQTSGAILQRLDPDAVAPGHNPDRLTVAQVGIADGWRLLTEKEAEEFLHKDVRPTAFWDPDDREWSSIGDDWWIGPSETLRTKAEKLEVVS